MFSYSSGSLLVSNSSLGAGATNFGFKGTTSGEDSVVLGSHVLLDC